PADATAVEEAPPSTAPATTATVPVVSPTPASTDTPTRGGKRHRHR
ncbi:hypothetical protein GT030_33995, partial [Streptomyces sp. SID1328]|nr:hypothetical protein [Streptomyces sp. SID1328]